MQIKTSFTENICMCAEKPTDLGCGNGKKQTQSTCLCLTESLGLTDFWQLVTELRSSYVWTCFLWMSHLPYHSSFLQSQ